MPTILLKKSDTPGSVPGTANLTNLAGGVEVAVNTADKRVYSMTSASAVIELGTNPSSLTCSDVSATVLRAGSATITNLIATSASITTLTNNPTFSGGTANGVLYLNGSKVATSGSTLVFNGTNLGIGTNSPSKRIDARTSAAGEAALITISNDDTSGTTVSSIEFASSGVAKASIAAAVYGDGWLSFRNNNNTEKMVLAASGNLGLGVTPSAWRSTEKAIQIGSWMGLFTDSGITTEVSYNNYINSSNQRIYQNTGYALRYQQYNGIHSWHTAPSGTAGNQITGANAFVQTMTLDASGNLLVGTTSANGVLAASGRGYIEVNGTTDSAVGFESNGTLGGYLYNSATEFRVSNYSNNPLTFHTNNAERARITAGGYSKFSNDGTYVSSTGAYHEFRNTDAAQPILYLTATSGSYTGQTIYINNTRAASSAYKFYSANANAVEQFYVRGDGVLYAQNTTIQSLSDGRLKENVRNATEGLDVVNALRPVRYDWKAGYGNDRKDQLGFIAQEVEAVFPDAVSEWSKAEGDDEPYKTVGPGALIPVLVKAIQELTARVAALESK